MKYALLISALTWAALTEVSLAQNSGSLPVLNLPGQLQTFLSTNPNASRRQNSLGTLRGRGKTEAAIAAIVASDPAHPTRGAKGLEFELTAEDGERHATVYLDEAGLGLFERELTQTWEIASHNVLHESQADPSGVRGVIGAVNQVDSPGNNETRRAIVLAAGWYQEGDTPGIYLDCAPGGPFYFPNLPLSALIDMIEKGRVFLTSPPSGRSDGKGAS